MKAEMKKAPKQLNRKPASIHNNTNLTTAGFADNRNSTARQLQQMDGISNAPLAIAQRKQLDQAFENSIQKVEGEELIQGKFATAQRVEPVEDELLQGKFKTVQRAAPEEEELLQGKFETAQREPLEEEEEEEEPLQGKFSDTATTTKFQEETTPPVNKTGMPEQLKSGIESLSGMDMSDVRVHKNSSNPAQLNALAYAQGNDIHLGAGQEQHLPHEAWHVVQQRQGRVKPTVQMAGEMVNNDASLEKEADVMGSRAAVQRMSKSAGFKPSSSSENSKLSPVVQKRDPGTYTLTEDTLLTHGSAANVFDLSFAPVTGFSKTSDVDKPGAPAWMAQDNEQFSIHATLVMQGYKKLGDTEKKQLTVHTYKTEKIDLHSWDNWGQVPEYLFRKGTTPGDYDDGGKSGDKRDTYGMDYAKSHTGYKFHWNTKEAAKEIKGIAGGDGYHINEDRVLKQPEEILFEGGMNKIKKDVKREFEVSWILAPKKQLQVLPTSGGGGTYYWDTTNKKAFGTKKFN